jgi:hypothetical protein
MRTNETADIADGAPHILQRIVESLRLARLVVLLAIVAVIVIRRAAIGPAETRLSVWASVLGIRPLPVIAFASCRPNVRLVGAR